MFTFHDCSGKKNLKWNCNDTKLQLLILYILQLLLPLKKKVCLPFWAENCEGR